ncbi:MAG TPA: flavodoxin family protein [candidate division Zixibacteria bacterium]
MRVLAISGSPVNGGNVEVLLEEISMGAESRGAKFSLIHLNDLEILPCQACGKSLEPNFCFYADGMGLVYEKLLACDILVLGSPIYFDSLSAQTKLFIDRCNCIRPIVETPKGDFIFKNRFKKQRKGVAVLVGGKRGRFEGALTVLRGFFKWGNFKLVDSLIYKHDDWEVGGVKNNKEVMKRAFELGEGLAQGKAK